MLLSHRRDTFSVPHSSMCVIHTKGLINDGDTVEVTSPVFASVNFSSRAVNMSDRFDVIARIPISGSIENNLPDGEFKGILKCDDNDVFHMYVEIHQEKEMVT